MKETRRAIAFLRELLHRVLVAVGAIALTLAFFLVLPLIQAIAKPPTSDMLVRDVDTSDRPKPQTPPEPEPEKEEEPKEEPPKLAEESAPLDLAQLELALNPGFGGDWTGGSFAVNLQNVVNAGESVEGLFSVADLDQKPRVVYQPSPIVDAKLRKKAPGTVYIVFVVDQNGRVTEPIVQKSTDPVFEKPALAAVKQWKFEPGKRSGQPVRFRMRVPITFPQG